MSDFNRRSDMVRRIEKKMKRRSRKVSAILMSFGLVVGFGLGIWLSVTKLPDLLENTGLGRAPSATGIPAPTSQDDATLVNATIAPEQPTPAPQVLTLETDSSTPAPEPTPEPDVTIAPPADQENPVSPTDALETASPLPVTQTTPRPEPFFTFSVAPREVSSFEPTQAPDPTTPIDAVEPNPTPFEYVRAGRGDRGERVTMVQQRMIELGYLTGEADGQFGKMTEEAVRNYQKDNGLLQNGIADKQTQDLLFAAEAEPEATPAPENQNEMAAPEQTPDPVFNFTIAMGERIDHGGKLAFTIGRYDFSQTVLPSNANPDEIYSHFEVSNGDMTYLYLTGTIENLSGEPIYPNQIRFSIATDDQKEYEGHAAIEMDNGANLSSYGEVQGGESTTLILLVEVPSALALNGEPIESVISIENITYMLTLR